MTKAQQKRLVQMQILLASIFSLLIPGRLVAGEIHLASDVNELSIGQVLQIYEDPTNQKVFADIQSLPQHVWQSSSSSIPTLGFTTSSYWLKFRATNTENIPLARMLEFAYSHYDRIHIYLKSDESVTFYKMGDRKPFDQRDIDYRNFLVPIKLSPHESVEVYANIKTSGPFFLPVNIWNVNDFGVAKANRDHVAGYYYGILLAMFGYKLFLYLTTLKRVFLYYICYTAGFFFFQFSLHGFAFHFLWPELPWWANTCVAFFQAFAMFWFL
jgi:hypothetical protein